MYWGFYDCEAGGGQIGKYRLPHRLLHIIVTDVPPGQRVGQGTDVGVGKALANRLTPPCSMKYEKS